MMLRLRAAPAVVLAGALSLVPAPARAIPAGEARTRSFKLQNEGMRLYREGKYREAIEAFDQVVNLNLNSFLAYYYLGVSLVADRRYSDAIEPLKVALDLQPDHIQAHLALGDAYLKLGDASESRAEYLRALDLQANYAPALDGLGRLFESTGRDKEAEEQYRKALEVNVAFADSYTHLGDLFLRQGRLGEGIDLFLKAIAIRPDFSGAYTRLALAYARQGQFDDAIAAARKSQALAPQDPEPYVALARVYLDLENVQRSEAEAQAALAHDHDHPGAHMILSDLKLTQGDFDAAIEILQSLYERGIEDAQMRQAVGQALERARAQAQEFTRLQAAVAETGGQPGGPAAAVALARFFAAQGAHRHAAALLEETADALQEEAAAPIRFEAGLELLAARRYPAAITLFERLAGDAPPAGGSRDDLRAAALFNLGVGWARLGLPDRAATVFASYLKERPTDARAHLYLANASLRLGRHADARAHYQFFLDRRGPGDDTDEVRTILAALKAGGAAGESGDAARDTATTPPREPR